MAKVSKAKNISAGVAKTTKKAPMVDPKGAYTKVQQRTLGNMKKGGELKKAQDGYKASKAAQDWYDNNQKSTASNPFFKMALDKKKLESFKIPSAPISKTDSSARKSGKTANFTFPKVYKKGGKMMSKKK